MESTPNESIPTEIIRVIPYRMHSAPLDKKTEYIRRKSLLSTAAAYMSLFFFLYYAGKKVYDANIMHVDLSGRMTEVLGVSAFFLLAFGMNYWLARKYKGYWRTLKAMLDSTLT